MDSTEEEVKSPQCLWRVEEVDEAKYNFSDQKGVWQPKPEDILSVFERLAKGGALPLKWTCPGRRPPESDTPHENEGEMETDMAEDHFKEEYNDPEPSAFDFDDSLPDTNTKVTPWRSHAGMARTPKTEKRVARMDNIMDSLRKQQIQRAAEREARKFKGGTPSRVQQGRGRLIKFGSPLSKKSGSAAPISSLFSASSPSEPTDFDTGVVNMSSSSSTTAVSSSTVTQASVNNASPDVSTHTLLPSPLEAPAPKLQGQDLKNEEEENTFDGQQKNEEKDSRREENVLATSVATGISSSTTTSSSSPTSFVTISSDAQKRHMTTSASLPGLGYQNSEHKTETSAGQVVSGDSIVTSTDADAKTSNPTSTLVTLATSSSYSVPSSNANVSASKPSSSSNPNTSTVTSGDEWTSESTSVITSATGNMGVSVNESSEQNTTSFVASSSTETTAQSDGQTEQIKSSESNFYPSTVNPSQASLMPGATLPKTA